MIVIVLYWSTICDSIWCDKWDGEKSTNIDNINESTAMRESQQEGSVLVSG